MATCTRGYIRSGRLSSRGGRERERERVRRAWGGVRVRVRVRDERGVIAAGRSGVHVPAPCYVQIPTHHSETLRSSDSPLFHVHTTWRSRIRCSSFRIATHSTLRSSTRHADAPPPSATSGRAGVRATRTRSFFESPFFNRGSCRYVDVTSNSRFSFST